MDAGLYHLSTDHFITIRVIEEQMPLSPVVDIITFGSDDICIYSCVVRCWKTRESSNVRQGTPNLSKVSTTLCNRSVSAGNPDLLIVHVEISGMNVST
jgi:hypothetical protein